MSLLKNYTYTYFIYSQCLLKLCHPHPHLRRGVNVCGHVCPARPRQPRVGTDLSITQPAWQPLPGESKAILF